MTIQITRWSPDTCDCVIDYSWDSTTSEDDRIHAHHQSIKTCTSHAGITGSDHHNIIVRENQSKNYMHAHAVRLCALQVGLPSDTTELVEGVEFEWSFIGSGNARELQVKLHGTNPGVVAQLRAHANEQAVSTKVL